MISMENTGYRKANINHGVTKAREFGLDLLFATNARRRFLMDELELLELEIAYYDEAIYFDGAHVAFSPCFVITVSDFEAEAMCVESLGLFDICVGQDDSDSCSFGLRAVV